MLPDPLKIFGYLSCDTFGSDSFMHIYIFLNNARLHVFLKSLNRKHTFLKSDDVIAMSHVVNAIPSVCCLAIQSVVQTACPLEGHGKVGLMSNRKNKQLQTGFSCSLKKERKDSHCWRSAVYKCLVQRK